MAAVLSLLVLAGCAPPLAEIRIRLSETPSCCADLNALGYAPAPEPGSSRVIAITSASPVFDFATGRSPFAALALPMANEPLRLTVESYMQSALQSPTTGDQYFFAPRATLLDANHRPLRALESATRRVRSVPLGEFAVTGGLGWKIVLRTRIDPSERARFVVIHTTDALLGLATEVPAVRAASGTALIAHAPVGRLRVGLEPVAALLESVLVLERRPAYTVFVGVPAGRTQSLLDAIPADRRTGVRAWSWPDFLEQVGALLAEAVEHDDYPEVPAGRGLVELLAEHPGSPFGITWNGGIAITAGDYVQAEARLADYRSDPERYRRSRPGERRADRLHPLNHLDPLLGW